MLSPEKETPLDLFWWPAESKDKTDLEASYAVLNDLYNWFSLEDLKACLWTLLKVALENESEHGYADASPRNLIFLYEHICDLAAAAYVIARAKKILERNCESTINAPEPEK